MKAQMEEKQPGTEVFREETAMTEKNTRRKAGARKAGVRKAGVRKAETWKAETRRAAPHTAWRYLAGLAALGLFCMAGAAAGVCISRMKTPASPPGLVYEANVVMGDIPGKSLEERQRELNAVVEEGMIAMSMNATPSGKVTGADRRINWLIENPANQGKLIRVEITRDDTGEKIYETGAIPPGNYVESAPLDQSLEAGIYDCTAVFLAYREKSEEYIGQAALKIRLTLQE